MNATLTTPTQEAVMNARLLSIDIGRTGALALFVDGVLFEIVDMPTLADGPAGRPTINAALLASLARRLAPTEAVYEFVSARPGEAPSGAFAFGRSRGVIEGRPRHVRCSHAVCDSVMVEASHRHPSGTRPEG